MEAKQLQNEAKRMLEDLNTSDASMELQKNAWRTLKKLKLNFDKDVAGMLLRILKDLDVTLPPTLDPLNHGEEECRRTRELEAATTSMEAKQLQKNVWRMLKKLEFDFNKDGAGMLLRILKDLDVTLNA